MLVHELLTIASITLAKAGVENAQIDAELLLGHCLKKSRSSLYLLSKEELSVDILLAFKTLLKRREQREPLAYILGVQEFWSMDFLVSSDVLIPRPETEQLLETAIKYWKDSTQHSGYILDLCCGSGVIAIVLAKELGVKILAIDISREALLVAKENSKKNGVLNQIHFMQSDLFSACINKPFISMIVSNPPYVSQQDIAHGLQNEVQCYEPHLALDGGDKGLEIITRIAEDLSPLMLSDSTLFMEIGAEQGADVISIFTQDRKANNTPYENCVVSKDYSGHDRIFHTTIK